MTESPGAFPAPRGSQGADLRCAQREGGLEQLPVGALEVLRQAKEPSLAELPMGAVENPPEAAERPTELLQGIRANHDLAGTGELRQYRDRLPSRARSRVPGLVGSLAARSPAVR